MNKETKKVPVKVLEGYEYDEELPDIDLLHHDLMESEKKRLRKEEWTNKYGNSPIPPDLSPDYIKRTPTPTLDMIKKDLDEKRKKDRWEEGRKRPEKGGRRRTRRKSNKRKSKSFNKKKGRKGRKRKQTKRRQT